MTKPMLSFTITVPASSSNIGPGFDVLGLTLSTYLTLKVQVFPSDNPSIILSYTGDGAESVSLVPEKNLIATTASYVLSSKGIHDFPGHTIVKVDNTIPFGRGLGSSGAAVVAGVMLGNELGGFGMSKERLLDYCLSIERHPDNVTAALMGGFVASYLRELDLPEKHVSETCPHSEEESDEKNNVEEPRESPSNKCKTNGQCAVTAAYEQRSAPPKGIGHFIRLGWSPRVKAVVIVPQFELSTAKARAVLPDRYERVDVVYNLQRLAVLTSALGQEEPDADLVYQAMQDRMHQPYRQHLVPGLPTILSSVTPKTVPGCIGICLSGAGPTILALATGNFDTISERVCAVLKAHGVDAVTKVLDIVQDGASCVYD